MLARLAPLLFLVPLVFAQTEVGELHLTLTDASGLPVEGAAELASQANQYVRTFTANAEGHVTAKRLSVYTAGYPAEYGRKWAE